MTAALWLPTVRIELGLTGATIDPAYWRIGDSERGKIGTAEIGPDEIWTDITTSVRSWGFHRGAGRGDGPGPPQYDAGTATIEVNNGDAAFDPMNLSGPYVQDGATLLTPMVRVRIVAEWDGIAYSLYYGYVDQFVPDYSSPTWSTTTITATDAFKVATSYDRGAVGVVGANELTGARMGRILDSINWDVDDRDIAAGLSNVQATTLAGNALTELQGVALSEMGEFYIGRDGATVFKDRHAVLTEERATTSQVTFGDAGIGAGEVPYASTATDHADDTMANRVTAQIIGGAEQTVNDATSEARYLTKTWRPPSDLWLTTDADALSWAQAVLSQAKNPELRFAQVQLNVPGPEAAPTVWPLVLDRELGDRATVIRRPPGGGTNERDVFVRGIEMQSDGADWKTTFIFQAADRYQFWTIGDPVLGRIGSNAIAF